MDNQFQDIMPLEDIAIDTNIYFIYIGLFILAGLLIYLYTRFLFKKDTKTPNPYEQKIQKLKELDLDRTDTKQMLYEFTLLAKDTMKEKERLNLILDQIEPLKYKKDEVILDKKLKDLLRGYIDDC